MLIKTGGIVERASGKLNGIVFSHNRFGAYVRAIGSPVNPNTDRQQAVRNIFQTLAELWKNTLTEAQRTAWELYAASVPVLNRLGDSIYLTGLNHYIRSNVARIDADLTRVDDGPTNFTLADSDPAFACAISEATQEITVTFDDTLDWASEDDAMMQIRMTRPVNESRQFINPIYQVADYLEGDSGTPLTSTQAVACPFVVTEDQLVIVEGRISRADGRLSQKFRDTVSIAS